MNGEEFCHSEVIQDFISKNKESDTDFNPDEDKGINLEEKFGHFLNCFNETVTEKSFDYFLDILKKDNDDFLTYLRSRSSSQLGSYYQICSELFIFTTLRYHEDKFDDYYMKAYRGISYLAMSLSYKRSDYARAFPKKGKSKKKQ
jgi:hypothetical protein